MKSICLLAVALLAGCEQPEPQTADGYLKRARERMRAEPEAALEDIKKAEALGASVKRERDIIRAYIALKEGRYGVTLTLLEPYADDERAAPLERAAKGRTTLTIEAPGHALKAILTRLNDKTHNPEGQDEELGMTPVREHDVGVGTYRLQLIPEQGATILRELLVRRDDLGWPRPVTARVDHLAPDGFCLIPGGPFVFGGADPTKENPTQNPRETRSLPPFVIARAEVTNEEYGKYLDSLDDYRLWRSMRPLTWSKGIPPFGFGNVPVSGIDFFQAMVCSASTGRRLPTEHEWEKAGRGAWGRIFPWGNDATKIEELEGQLDDITRPTVDMSPFGVRGLSSQVGEWTHTSSRDSFVDPGYGGRGRGGSYAERGLNMSDDFRKILRTDFLHDLRLKYAGFRVAASLQPADPVKGLESKDPGVRLEAVRQLKDGSKLKSRLARETDPFVLVAMLRKEGVDAGEKDPLPVLVAASWIGEPAALKALAARTDVAASIQLARLGDPDAIRRVVEKAPTEIGDRELGRFVQTQGGAAAARSLLKSQVEKVRARGKELAGLTRAFDLLAVAGADAVAPLKVRNWILGRLEEIDEGVGFGDPQGLSVLIARKGAIHLALGNLEAADREFGRALEAYPQNVRAIWLRALGRIRSGGDAMELLNHAVKIPPIDPDRGMAYLLRSILRLRAGDADGAYKDMLRAKDCTQDESDLAYLDALKGTIELARGKKRRARRLLRKAVHEPPSRREPFLDCLIEFSLPALWQAWKQAD